MVIVVCRGRHHGFQRHHRAHDFAASWSGRERTQRHDVLLLQSQALDALCAVLAMFIFITGEAQLAQIGLLSFAVVAQFAPAFFGGLSGEAHARSTITGITIGVAV
jgi:Na+/proline symporter